MTDKVERKINEVGKKCDKNKLTDKVVDKML